MILRKVGEVNIFKYRLYISALEQAGSILDHGINISALQHGIKLS